MRGPTAPSANIAHCIHGLGLGGAQKVIVSLTRGLAAPRLRHFVYSSSDGDLRSGVEQTCDRVRIIRRHLPKFDPVWILRLAAWMQRDRIDLVHTHLFGDSLHGYLAARLAGGIPVIMTLHTGTQGLSPIQRWGYDYLLPRCSRVVACSEAVRNSFSEHYNVAAGRFETIVNGIDMSSVDRARSREPQALRSALGAAPGEAILASVGRLSQEKGQKHLISAFASLSKLTSTPPRLVFIGDGPLRKALESQARTAGVEDRIVFAGFRADVLSLLGAVDIVVFSSLYEGLPIALLEAMAASRCIVATDVPGICEAVCDGKEALIVPAARPDQLCEALLRVVTDADLRAKLGRAARQRFLRGFTADRMVRQYDDLYRAILQGPATSG